MSLYIAILAGFVGILFTISFPEQAMAVKDAVFDAVSVVVSQGQRLVN